MFDRVGKTDPVTRGIEITVNYLGIQFDVRPTHTFLSANSHPDVCPAVKIIIEALSSSVVNMVKVAFSSFFNLFYCVFRN